MIIIAGQLRVDPAERERYLAAVGDVARLARSAPGCLDFVQAADPIDPTRINVYERWIDDEHVEAFRKSGPRDQENAPEDEPEPELPAVRAADVRKFRIAAEEAP